MDNIGALIVPAAIALFAISIVARGIRIVQQAQTMIIERLGKYHRTLASGVNLIIPIIDKPRAIDWHQVIVTPAGDSFARPFRTEKIDLAATVYEFRGQKGLTTDKPAAGIGRPRRGPRSSGAPGSGKATGSRRSSRRGFRRRRGPRRPRPRRTPASRSPKRRPRRSSGSRPRSREPAAIRPGT